MEEMTLVRPTAASRASPAPCGDLGARRVVLVGLLVALVLVALLAVTQLIDFGVFNLRLRALNADKRDSIFGIVSLMAQTALAGAGAWRARALPGRSRAWLALAVLVAGLVLVRGLATYNASVLAVPLACVLFLLCWLTWRDPVAARTVLWTGLALMVLSLALHQVGPDADASTASDFTWSYQITGVVKHGGELAGWILAATAVLTGARDGRSPSR